MLQSYKVFKSTEFVDRSKELEHVLAILKERSKGVIIFEGDRGSGKTSLLFEFFRCFDKLNELRPFLVSLFPYSVPEFESQENICMNSERPFQGKDIPELLDQLAHYMEIDFIESKNPNFQKEYLARGLAYRTSEAILVLLVDSIYECSEDTRVEIERYLLTPILDSERVFLIMSGRGRSPFWSRPELQMAKIIDLSPLEKGYVKEQLEKMKSIRAAEHQKIAEFSNGNPLIVRVTGESKKELPDALNDAIDIIVKDTLPDGERNDERYKRLRTQLEKLSLVNRPFRMGEVEDYLYPNDPEQHRKTNDLFDLMLESRILSHEGKGYQINQSIIHPIRKWLQLQGQRIDYQNNLIQLRRVSKKLQDEHPSISTLFQQMIPPEAIDEQTD